MKSIKFLFPLPSIIVTVLLGALLSKATVNGRAIAFSEWVIFMLVLFLVIVIPLDIVLYFLKRKMNNRSEGDSSHEKLIHKLPVNDKESQGISCYLKAIIPKSKMDPLFEESGRFMIEKNKASIGMLQRYFHINFNRAARIMDQLADCGVVGDEAGTKPREILASMKEFEYFMQNYEHLYRSVEPKRKQDEDPMIQRVQLYNNQYDYMEGHEFEYFCAQLLRENGFENVTVTQGSGDQGVDIIAYKEGVKYGIQCKCYSSDIGNKAIQEVFSGAKFYDCHVPVVLTNRHFTASAKELAEKTNVLMWDREYLDKLVFAATPDAESDIT